MDCKDSCEIQYKISKKKQDRSEVQIDRNIIIQSLVIQREVQKNNHESLL